MKTNTDYQLIVFGADLTRHTITLCKELTLSQSGENKPQGVIKANIKHDIESYVFEHILSMCIVTIGHNNTVISIRSIE